MSAIKGVIDQVPGLAPSQKKLLSSMLDGNANPTAMQDSMQEILSDPEQVETARQQMLENPGKIKLHKKYYYESHNIEICSFCYTY